MINIFNRIKTRNNIFKVQEHAQNTRRNQLSPSFRTKLFRNSLLCSGPDIWNSLPNEMKKRKKYVYDCSLNSFKDRIKKKNIFFFLLQQQEWDEWSNRMSVLHDYVFVCMCFICLYNGFVYMMYLLLIYNLWSYFVHVQYLHK